MSALAADCQELVRAEIGRRGSIKAVAGAIGYARASLSLAMAGRYTGGLGKMEAAIRATFVASVACPHLAREIAALDCKSNRERPIPTAEPIALKLWVTCQTCPNNPNRRDQ